MASAVKVKSGFVLAELDLDRRLKDEMSYQQSCASFRSRCPNSSRSIGGGIIALEGWDASGKSGAIQRLIEKLDPRWVQVWSIGRPTPEEQGRHYLWRFWQRLPPPGNLTIFDRRRYGRVLVERVEALARPKEWQRAYDEINSFETALVDDVIRLVKLFLHISDEEQLRRFRERVITPTKHWKMTAEDIRNRARRREYLAALEDMFALTSTTAAPWYVVPRIAVATTAVKILAKGITVEPPALDPEVIRTAREILSQREIAVLGLPTPERSER